MSDPRPPLPRVLFVNHASRMGGAEFILLDIVRGFAGRSSAWLFEDGPLRSKMEQLGMQTLLPRTQGNLTGIKRDRSLLRAIPKLGEMAAIVRAIATAGRAHEVVYANSQKAFVLSTFAAALARRPLIWHLHDILTEAHFGERQLKLVRILANRFAARVIVPSTAAGAAFVAAGGRKSLLRLVPNGVTLDTDHTDWDDTARDDMARDDMARARLRARLGLPSGFVFGVFSRLAPWKGQRVALEALARLPDASCLIVGSALFGEDLYEQELRSLAATLGVTPRVRFLGQRDDVPTLMRAIDVVVHPSTSPEPFGRTLVEAMLSRTPVIAADSGAAAEILQGGEAGVLVPPGDPAALAGALRRLRFQPQIAAGLVERGERRAREMFSAARMRAGVEAVTREVATARDEAAAA